MASRSTIATLVLPLVVAACQDPIAPGDEQIEAVWVELGKSCGADAPAYSLSAAARDSLAVHSDGIQTIDDEWAELARDVPGGWGGLFYEDGTLTLYLVEPSKRKQAIDALIPYFRDAGESDIADELPTAQVKKGRWDFAQLDDWYLYLQQHVWQDEGVTQSDIAEQRNRLEYGVQDEDARRRISELLAGMDVPCFLVALDIVSPAELD